MNAASRIRPSSARRRVSQLCGINVSVLAAFILTGTAVAYIRRLLNDRALRRSVPRANVATLVVPAFHTQYTAVVFRTEILLSTPSGVDTVVVQIKRAADNCAVGAYLSGHGLRTFADILGYLSHGLSGTQSGFDNDSVTQCYLFHDYLFPADSNHSTLHYLIAILNAILFPVFSPFSRHLLFHSNSYVFILHDGYSDKRDFGGAPLL